MDYNDFLGLGSIADGVKKQIDSFTEAFKDLAAVMAGFGEATIGLAAVGTEVKNVSTSTGGLMQGMKDFASSFDTLTKPVTQLKTLNTIMESTGGFMTLLSKSAEDSSKETGNALESIELSFEAAGKAAEDMSESTKSSGTDIAQALGPMVALGGLYLAQWVATQDLAPGVTITLGILAGAFVALGVAMTMGFGPVGWIIGALAGLVTAVVAISTSLSKDVTPEVERFGDAVSDSTEQALSAFYDLHDDATAVLHSLKVEGTVITDEMCDSMTSSYRKMHDQIAGTLEAQKNEEIADLQYLYQEQADILSKQQAIWAEEVKGMEKKADAIARSCGFETEEYQRLKEQLTEDNIALLGLNEEQVAAAQARVDEIETALGDELEAYTGLLGEMETYTDEREQQLRESATGELATYLEKLDGIEANYELEINNAKQHDEKMRDLLKEASDGQISIEDEKYAELIDGNEEYKKMAIDVLAETEEEKAAILENEAEWEKLQGLERATAMAEIAYQQKDDAVKAAWNQYNERIEAAEKMLLDEQSIDHEKYEKLKKEAWDYYEEQYDKAEEECENSLNLAKAEAGEHVDLVNWRTGKVKSKWTQFWDNLFGITEKGGEDVNESAEKMGEDLTSSFEGTMKDSEKAMGDGMGNVLEAGNNAAEINSPSKATTRTGEALGQGLALGIQNTHGAIVASYTGIINDVLSATEGMVNNVLSAWHNMLSQLARMASAVPDGPTVTVPGFSYIGVPRLAVGLDYVPYDEFPAMLHKGEAVLTSTEATQWRGIGGFGGLKALLAGSVHTGAVNTNQHVSMAAGYQPAAPKYGLSPSGGLTVADIADAVQNAIRKSTDVFAAGDLYIGDEQVARAADRGRERMGVKIGGAFAYAR